MQQKVRKKKIPVLMLILKGVYFWSKIQSLRSLAVLKCEGRTILHAVKYRRQPGSALIIILRMASLDILFLCSVEQQGWLCS